MNWHLGNTPDPLMLLAIWCLINVCITYILSRNKIESILALSILGGVLAIFIPLNFVLFIYLAMKPKQPLPA